MDVMQTMAPSFLAESWDNVGLQVGHEQWQVDKVLVALEPTVDVVERACANNVSLLITHHPLIYRALSSVDLKSPAGRIIGLAVRKQLAIFSAHTNLDSAAGGVNDILAERVGLGDTTPLRSVGVEQYKLVVFVPSGQEERALDILFGSGAGKADRYSHISVRTQALGTCKAAPTAKPSLDNIQEVIQTPGYRIETVVAKQDLSAVINTMSKAYPHEQMACDVYPMRGGCVNEGLGRIGNLTEEILLEELVQRLKEALGLKTVRMVGDPKQNIKRVAVCGGSGKDLVSDFLASDAQAYVSGDLGYHDGRAVEAAGRALVDIGHFASEHLVVGSLVARLRQALSEGGFSVQVELCKEETDCFQYV